ncbi:MAG: helix-hairpin-helix domain-containing protein [Euryarchaeota archaeon]|nr:helix-hairpin-helix domain-containing protein [Euryarchaeota archaeon]
MTEMLRLPFIGEERSRILLKKGYDLERIRNSTPEEISEILGVSKYIAFLIIKAARESNPENVPDELIAEETLCPGCGAIVTELEYECGSCGYVLKDINPVEYQTYMSRYVELFIEISKDPENIKLWEDLKKILEALGNIEEALDVSSKIDYIKSGIVLSTKSDMEEKKLPIKESAPKKPKFKNGLVNGFGVQLITVEKRVRARRYLAILIVLGIVAGTLIGLYFMNSPFKIDGNFDDWNSIPGYHTFDSQIKIFKMGEYGNNYYFYIAGDLSLKLGVSIFVDSDGNPDSGYWMGSIGADYRLLIHNIGNKLQGTIYSFEGNNPTNWALWKNSGGFKVAGYHYGIEMQVPKNIFTRNAVVMLVDGEHRGYPIGLFHPVVLAEMELGGGVVKNGTSVGTLYLNNTFKSPTKITSISVDNMGNASSLHLRAIIDGKDIPIKDGKILLNSSLILDKTKVIRIEYLEGGTSGSTIRLSVKNLTGVNSFKFVTGDGYYVKKAPSAPRIDGVFYDWAPYRHSAPVNDLPPNVDIVSYAKYMANNNSYFYLQTKGEIASGTIIPVYGTTVKDSDRDTIPDNLDPYPHDFNNDGIPDDKSYVVINGTRYPDVDGDGIPDYPQGPDMWLNTTIPNTTAFPLQYRGKFVSVYIGPPKAPKPEYPYDYIEIYISGNNGYPIGGIYAQYLFRLYGLSGTIKGYNFLEYRNGKFVNKTLSFDLHTNIAEGWKQLEMKLPISITGRNVVYRIVSYEKLWQDTAHLPFQKSNNIPMPIPHTNKTKPQNSTEYMAPGKDDFEAGAYGEWLKQKFGNEVRLNTLTSWISSLNLSEGAEKNHVFTASDFIDGNVSHFKEEKYAANKLRELKKEAPDKPVYRVQLLNESIFREEWQNLTIKTKEWEILHYTHDLERYRLKEFGYFRPYKPNWYDADEIRTIEWLVYKLSENLSDWHTAFAVAKGIKSLDDARLGPLYMPHAPSTELGAGTHAVTVHVVDYYSGESDCNGENDIYYYVWIGNEVFESPERDDQNSWSGDDAYTNYSVTGDTVQIGIHVYEADSGLCGSDDDYGYVTFTYNLTTKLWSGGTSAPYAYTDGPDGWCDVWFHVQSDSDNNPSTINYGTVGAGTYGYIIQAYNGKSNYNDPSDNWTFSIDSTLISTHAVIYVGMAPNSGANFNIALYDPNGNEKASSASAGTGGVERIFYQLQLGDTAGTWTATVSINSTADYGDYYIFLWCGYKVEFYAYTDNAGPHTPMHSNNGVNVSYVVEGVTHYVWPNDDYYWTVYVDRGSSYSYAAESNLSNDAGGHRWISQTPPSGTISASTTITGHYYEQFYLTINTTYDTGYSSGQLFGAAKNYSAPGSGWYDAGCKVTIKVDSPVSDSSGKEFAFTSWTGSGTGSYSGTANPANFTIQDVTTETANWEQVPEFSGLVWVAPALALLFITRRRRK